MFSSYGQLIYTDTSLIVTFDNEITRYYRSLIPKHIHTNGMRYSPHITVVRTGKDIVINKDFWNRYTGEFVEFVYDNILYNDNLRFWLNVYCQKLEDIRYELGLSVDSPFNIPPNPFKKTFHSTICRIDK